jgi:hypothetical protein
MPSEKVLSAVEEAEQELRRLQKEHADLLKKIEMLQTFIRSGLALTGREPSAGQVPLMVAPVLPQLPSLNGQAPPVADQVATILRSAGRPLHMKEIVRQLRNVRNLEAVARPERSVSTAMKRRKGQFKRVAPNTFQLASAIQ